MPFNKDKLKARRKEIGATLQDIADKLGVSKQTIQRYESGKIEKINTDTVEKLAEALNTNAEFLMDWGECEQQKTSEEITKDEKELLENFRSVNEEGKEKISEYARDVAESPRYEKKNFNEMDTQKQARKIK